MCWHQLRRAYTAIFRYIIGASWVVFCIWTMYTQVVDYTHTYTYFITVFGELYTMKLSKETLGILKNFSLINLRILISAGSTIRNMSPMKNILASAEITEVFPMEFGIYDLSQFLGTLSLFTDPDLEFDDDYVIITEDGTSVKYHYAASEIIGEMPTTIDIPEGNINIVIPASTLTVLKKASNLMKLTTLHVSKAHGETKLILKDDNNESQNTYDIDADCETTLDTFDVKFNMELMALLPFDYTVNISEDGISKWSNADASVVYYIALDQ